jgi:hypothetical protein
MWNDFHITTKLYSDNTNYFPINYTNKDVKKLVQNNTPNHEGWTSNNQIIDVNHTMIPKIRNIPLIKHK